MIKRETAENVISQALSSGAEFCEIFLEDRNDNNLYFADGAVYNAAGIHIHGAGIYLISGLECVYVYSTDTSEKGLLKLAAKGTELLKNKKAGASLPFAERSVAEPNPVKIYPGSFALKDKVCILSDTDKAIRAACAALASLDLAYFDTDQKVLIAASDGTWAEDRRVTSRIRASYVIRDGSAVNGGWEDYARPEGPDCLRDRRHLPKLIRAAAELAEELTLEEAPKGRFPVVFEGEGCVGTFFHEACGHQLETTHLQAETAYFRDKLGKKVASDCVTVVDDGTIPGMYGSSKYDDEGMPRQKNTLIQNGILKSFLVDRIGSIRLGVPRNGCGRRQNYTFAPAARMSNTYLAAGNDDPDEMIRDIDFGILAVSMGGGTGGQEFTLNLKRAYVIKDGKISHPVRNAMLVGRGDETLMKIDRVAKDVLWEESGAFCGAKSGLVNTTTSGVRMRVTDMVVG